MSHFASTGPTTGNPPLRGSLPADPVDGLIDRLANHLAPLFVTDPNELPAARLMAVRTIASYQPQTQADFINIARTISFSMSALAALGRAASEDLPPSLQLRYYGRANSLNHSAEQSERGMERRHRLQQTVPPSMPQAWAAAHSADAASQAGAADADPDMHVLDVAELERGEAAISAAVAEAMQDYLDSCPPAKPADNKPAADAAEEADTARSAADAAGPPPEPNESDPLPARPLAQHPLKAPTATAGPQTPGWKSVPTFDQRLHVLQQREVNLIREKQARQMVEEPLVRQPA